MTTLEHEAKTLLSRYGIKTPKSFNIADSLIEPHFLPCVIKSQVPVGGRGKAGGVVIVRSAEEFAAVAKHLFSHEIKGHFPRTLLVEELLEIEQELYLAVRLNTDTAQIELMAHKSGGVDVEGETGFEVYTISPKTFHATALLLAEYFNLEEYQFNIEEYISSLYKCLIKEDALLVEINPLVVTKNNELIAADCKMELDEAALFRHQQRLLEAEKNDVNFVEIDPKGTIATIANGAGLAMATLDAVNSAGFSAANFLDIGGGATEETVLTAFEKICTYSHVDAIVINIFGGITHCDEIAKAIISASHHIPSLPKLYVRLEGNRSQEAKAMLESADMKLYATLSEALNALTNHTKELRHV